MRSPDFFILLQIQTNDDSRDLDPDLVPLNHPVRNKNFFSSSINIGFTWGSSLDVWLGWIEIVWYVSK